MSKDNSIWIVLGIIAAVVLIFQFIPKIPTFDVMASATTSSQCVDKCTTDSYGVPKNYTGCKWVVLSESCIGSVCKEVQGCSCYAKVLNSCGGQTSQTITTNAGTSTTTETTATEEKTTFDWQSIPMSWYLIGGLILVLIFMFGMQKGSK